MALPDLLEGLPFPDLDQDAVDAASARVRDYCDWHIAPQITQTVTVPVFCGSLVLPSLYVVSVASVNGATEGFTWNESGRVDLTGVSVVPHQWYGGRRHATAAVTFTHGYESCPASVRAVVGQIAVRGLFPTPRLRSDTTGPFSEAYFDDGDPLASLYGYRRLVVG